MRIFALILIITTTQLYIYNCEQLPTLYQYYTDGGIKTGLNGDETQFTLNNKQLTILSGDLHYFRVLPHYWKDRLNKMKYAGLNTVQFYTTWNAHELHPNQFDFSGSLNVSEFLIAIKEADMFAIVRPGPYICSEWEFGGLPSWLLRDTDMKVRSNYSGYLNASEIYLKHLIEVIKPYQFSTNGGPIIAVQLENEFASFGNTRKNTTGDNHYITFLKDTYIKHGIKELLFTSDNNYVIFQRNGNIDNVLMTANAGNPKTDFAVLQKLQPNRPLFVTEFWTGSYYRYHDKYHTPTNAGLFSFANNYETCLFEYNASVSIYMFSGGTNFGFMNGANLIYNIPKIYNPSVTSYIDDAPISECGDYSDHLLMVKYLIEKLKSERDWPKLREMSETPKQCEKANYGTVSINAFLPLNNILEMIPKLKYDSPKSMEMIDLGVDYGQNYGYILYRTLVFSKFSKLTLESKVADRAIIAINERNIFTIDDINNANISINFTDQHFTDKTSYFTLDIIVENLGRLNFGDSDQLNSQRKGLNGRVFIDDTIHNNWTVYALEFDDKLIKSLTNSSEWKTNIDIHTKNDSYTSPSLYKTSFNITGTPKNTFIKLDEKLLKGVIFVNGFNIGRYWNIGPQKTNYIPDAILREGVNDIYIFELHYNYNNYDNITVNLLDRHMWY